MNNLKNLLVIAIVGASASVSAQTVWNGAPITFTKQTQTDPSLEANQDRITSNVWITRANRGGIYNAASESLYEDFYSPEDTEWAMGTTADLANLTFDNWEDTHFSEPLTTIGENMVLHLITDDIYIDIKFTSWSQGDGSGGGSGGGFSYERSTLAGANVQKVNPIDAIKLFPIPANDYVQISGIKQLENFEIYNILGELVQEGVAAPNQRIDITALKPGVYIMKLEEGVSIRFSKR